MMDVVRSDDVILTEIATNLHLDYLKWRFLGALEPVPMGRRDAGRHVLGYQSFFIAARHLCGPLHDDPVLRSLGVLLH